MNQISLDAKGGQFLADLANWQRESAPDNSCLLYTSNTKMKKSC